MLLSARGRLAGFYARTGQEAKAEALFREIVKGQANVGASQPALARVLQPYVEILLKKGNDPQAVADLFDATQAIVRPGVAETQAILARELSGGSDEASRLFRQAVNLDRQIERARLELARLEATPAAADRPRMNALRVALIEAQKDQVATQSRLADFPRFRAVSNATLPLSEVQNQLRDGRGLLQDDGGRRPRLRAARDAEIGAGRPHRRNRQGARRAKSIRCARRSRRSRAGKG